MIAEAWRHASGGADPREPPQAPAVDSRGLWIKPKIYELAAAVDVVDEDELDDVLDVEEVLVDVVDSVLVLDLSLLDSPALSLAVLDPPRLSVR